MTQAYEFGRWAEQTAAEYLENKNYLVLMKNYRYDKAEIDIIAQSQSELIIVEVKARKNDLYGEPHLFVSPSKIKLLTKAANAFVLAHNIALPVRFDIISITQLPFSITHIENAFTMDCSNPYSP